MNSKSGALRPLSWLMRLRLVLLGHDDLAGIVFWAALVGLAGALSSVAFRDALRLLELLFTGQATSLERAAAGMPWWHRILLPACGAVLAGFVLRLARWLLPTPRAVDFMEAVRTGDGRLAVRATLANAISSLFTISSGGSIGREGPMLQLAALCGSRLGLLGRAPVPRLRLMVACGAAAGVASAYNAPISGALFVSEIVLGNTAMESFGPLVVASVTASATVHRLTGDTPLYEVPRFTIASNWELVFFILLGVLLGHLAPPFLALLDFAKSRFAALRLPLHWQLGLGGLLVGAISIGVPQVWGNGFAAVNGILAAQLAGWWLLVILAAKVLATAATVGSGAVGGVFTPTLFVGCAIGALFGGVLHPLLPTVTSLPVAYALAGMGGLLAATTHAPLTSILMLFEMTLDYDMVLPLMLACVTAHYTAKVYRRGESVYQSSLEARRGGDWQVRSVGSLVKPAAATVSGGTTVAQLLSSLPRRPLERVYVADGTELTGWVDLRRLVPQVRQGQVLADVPVQDIAAPASETLTPDMSLGTALDCFLRAQANVLPVTSGQWSNNLLGEVSRRDVMLAMQDRM